MASSTQTPGKSGSSRAKSSSSKTRAPRWTDVVRFGVLGGLALAGLAGLGVARDAIVVADLESRARDILNGAGEYAMPAVDPCEKACPPRALAASAVILTLKEGAGERNARLAKAEERLERAVRERPKAGSWWTWLAYARAVRSGVNAEVISTYERSYQTSPFLAIEGAWRVRFGALNWRALSPETQARIVDEAVWLRDISDTGTPLALDPVSDPRAIIAIGTALARPTDSLVAHRRSRGPGGVGAPQK